MIKYTGSGNTFQIQIAAIGDGATTSFIADLNIAPFNLSFGTHPPTDVGLLVQDGPEPTVSLGAGAKLTVTYDAPLEAPTAASGFSPRSQFLVWLLYS